MIKISGNLTPHFTADEIFQNQSEYTLDASKLKNIMLLLEMMEELRTYIGKPVNVHGCYRTSVYNKKVGGNAKSNHMNGKAMDFDISGTSDGKQFLQYAKKWKEICEKHKVVGEAGIYTWGYHFGYQTYSKSFYNWDSRSGKQINMLFNI